MGSLCRPKAWRPLLFLMIPIFAHTQIAAVETAIPAFIGYTEKAGTGWMKPLVVTSFADFINHFGGPAREENLQVTIDHKKGDAQVRAEWVGEPSRHNLCYSIQAYFLNGGGPCYILPVAGYLTAGRELSADLLLQGLEVLDARDEPTLIVIPEAQNLPDLARIRTCYQAALEQCHRRRDRFAILDMGPHGPNDDILEVAKQFREEVVGDEYRSFGAAYAPNVRTNIPIAWDGQTSVVWQLPGGVRQSDMDGLSENDQKLHAAAIKALEQVWVVLPPSPFAAGVYGRTDSAHGVWEAPANAALFGVSQPVLAISDSQQEALQNDLAGKSINPIRHFAGQGVLVWGARTLDGNSLDWRYVSVRRLAIMLEESILQGAQWVVFEPNDEPLWTQVRLSIESFLTDLWRQGAFQGSKPGEAFFVRVGLGTTMTAQDILDGRLFIEVGFAPLRPAEFLILRVGFKMQA